MLCACGCGGETRLSDRTDTARGVIVGQPLRFLAGHNARRGRDGRCPHGHVLDVVGQDRRGECRACQRARGQAWHRSNPSYGTVRQRRRTLRKYGIDEAQYRALAEAQGHKCAICRQPPKPRRGVVRLHVDHDHATGAVRGLLCYACNWALGKFGDDPALLRRAADYLSARDRA